MYTDVKSLETERLMMVWDWMKIEIKCKSFGSDENVLKPDYVNDSTPK